MKDKIKNHIEKYKTIYCCAATGIVFAGITAVIMKERHAKVRGAMDEGLVLNKLSCVLSFFSKPQQHVVNVIEREGRGHPGYLTRCLETNDIFTSQTEAAKSFKIPTSVMSDHLRGKFDNAAGYHFERIIAA